MIRDLPATGAAVPHHIGFAVADLGSAMNELGTLLGVAWQRPVLGRADDFRSRGERVRWQLNHVKSTGANGLTVELLQGGPGSVWHVESGIAFHHYAYAPQHRVEELEAYLAAGWTVDVTRDVADPRESSFAYLVKDGHPRVELCLP
jgi:hypothetical protein